MGLMKKNASYWIRKLQLSPHVEGGWFRESYRSAAKINAGGSIPSFPAERSASTSIYFLLEKNQFSAFHRIRSDEQWHFYAGDPLMIYELWPDGRLQEHKLGNDPERGQSLQCTIMAGNWFASKTAGEGAFTLAACTVSPGFDFSDFELADRFELIRAFPANRALIEALTHSSAK